MYRLKIAIDVLFTALIAVCQCAHYTKEQFAVKFRMTYCLSAPVALKSCNVLSQ